ncbi:MAG: AAA family ATPase [Acidobacteriia bacterium]|nr:AAA family ATPase [Terriglobia bacterium]
MNLLRCNIQGFGRLAHLTFSFAGGLNVVYAANEAGKSTLQRFLMALLYGQLRADVKAQRRLDAWVEQYRPWRASDYGGTLWCSLANGRELEIHRTFGRDESRFEVLTTSGEDISRQYEIQRNGEVIFAASHLGLAKELFESVAVVRESETAELKHREPLRDRIANLAQSGDEKLSVRLSLVKLEEALEAVGSERAPTRPYKQALDRLQELKEERDELEALRRQCQAWIRERTELGSEIERLEQNLHAARRGVIDARWREARLRVRTLEEIDDEIRNLGAEIQSLGANPDFPVHRLDELNRLAADRDNEERRLEELRQQKQEAGARHEQGEAVLRNLASYAALHQSIEPEKITEWFVNYLSLSRQRDEMQRTTNRLLDETAAIHHRLETLSPALRDAGIDWERKALQAADEERAASQQSAVLVERVAQGKAEHVRIKGRARRQGLLAGIALTGLLAAAAAGFAGILPSSSGLALAAGLGVLGVTLLMMASKSRGAAQQARQAFEALDAGLNRLREQADAAQSEMRRAVTDSGFEKVEDFLAAARQAILDRQRLGDLAHSVSDAEQQRNRIQAEAEAVYIHLKECLTKAGLSCAPGNLKIPVDALRANMRRYAEIQAAQRRLALAMDALRVDEESVAARAARISAGIQNILTEGGVDSPDAFRQACQNCRRLLELRAREASRAREFDRLRGTFTFDQWKARLDELQGLRGGDGEGPLANGSTRKPPYLPYLPTVEEAEQEEKRNAAILGAKREEHARLVERVRQAFHNYRSPAEIEEDLAGAERIVQSLTLNRTALTLALEGIRSLARLQQEVCAPQLNRAVEERFLQICPDRYEEVKIDPDFRIQAREKGTAELRPAESLSRGTQDQLYLAVRFGVLELLGNRHEPCPCLLDEPFVAYDHERMCAAFSILEQEAGRRQLILFTCREDVRAQALLHGASLITI